MTLPLLLQSPELTLSQKVRARLQNPDLLELCHSVPKEVIQLGEAQRCISSSCSPLRA